MTSVVDELVDKLTAAKSGSRELLDDALLSSLKSELRGNSDSTSTQAAAVAVVTRLRSSDSRTRVRALLLCDWLFQRSRSFRDVLVPALPVRFYPWFSLPMSASDTLALRTRRKW